MHDQPRSRRDGEGSRRACARMWLASALALGVSSCAGLKRDPFPGTFRAGVLNDRHEHLYARPAVGALAMAPARSHGAFPAHSATSYAAPHIVQPSARPAEVPPLPPSPASPSAPVASSAEVPPLPPSPTAANTDPAPLVDPALQPARSASTFKRTQGPNVPALGTQPEPTVLGPAPAHLGAWLRHGESPHMRRERIAAFAASMVGARRIVANGRRYAANCSDFVRAVYSIEGVDLYKWPRRPRGFSGVRGMYGLARLSGGLHFRKRPEVGDLVFFHNTYDFNRNRRIDDFLSHVGVVEKVEPDGTVHYIDRSSGRIKRNRIHVARAHLWRDPATHKVLNSYVRGRRKGDPPGTRYLSGDLFAGFGTLIR